MTKEPDATIDAAFRELAQRYEDAEGADFCSVPEAEIRRFGREHGIGENVALGRYGWWADGGHRWPQFIERPSGPATLPDRTRALARRLLEMIWP